MRAAGAVALLVIGLSCAGCARQVAEQARPGTPAGRAPHIRPDYAGVLLPPNIAPLNFTVQEPGTKYYVHVSGHWGNLDVASSTPKIVFPERAWHRLLQANRGQTLVLDVFVRRGEGGWARFEPIVNQVAEEPIDRYLVCRQIDPAYNYWRSIGIYQRDLEGFGERCLLHSRMIARGCINCHAFPAGRTGQMTLGLRSNEYGAGTVLYVNGRVVKLTTKFGYTAWQPSGRIVMYSDNLVRQFFHSARGEVRDVVDLTSDLAYYDVAANAVKTTRALARPDRLETYPAWSPDGRWLYYCSAPQLWGARRRVPPEQYAQCRYDLLRINYDPAKDKWGAPETVLLAKDTGKSILLPRVSPDGRFVLFCMCDYGCFPIYQPSSDLYLLERATGHVRRLEINSVRSESWHSWSSNSRWIAFSSKRDDGLFTRTYLSYVDAEGRAYKPFVVPQRDPTFYDSFLRTYSVPELISEPVRTSPRQLAEAARSLEPIKPTDLIPKAQEDQRGGGTAVPTEPWQQAK